MFNYRQATLRTPTAILIAILTASKKCHSDTKIKPSGFVTLKFSQLEKICTPSAYLKKFKKIMTHLVCISNHN